MQILSFEQKPRSTCARPKLNIESFTWNKETSEKLHLERQLLFWFKKKALFNKISLHYTFYSQQLSPQIYYFTWERRDLNLQREFISVILSVRWKFKCMIKMRSSRMKTAHFNDDGFKFMRLHIYFDWHFILFFVCFFLCAYIYRFLYFCEKWEIVDVQIVSLLFVNFVFHSVKIRWHKTLGICLIVKI